MGQHPGTLIVIDFYSETLDQETFFAKFSKKFGLNYEFDELPVGNDWFRVEFVFSNNYVNEAGISAQKGHIIVYDYLTIGWRQKISLDKLRYRLDEINMDFLDIKEELSCNFDVYLTATFG